MRRSRKKNKWKWPLIIILVIVIIIGSGALFAYNSLRNTAEEIYQPSTTQTTGNESAESKEEVREEDVDVRQGDAVSILLLGMDSGGGRTTGEMNTDVMMLVTINPETDEANMISIPRDTYSDYTGGKINAAYAIGGAAGSMNAVQMLLDVPVDNYALVDMSGIMNIIDAVGGVTVYNDNAFSQEGYDFPVGDVSLNSGEQALSYMRNRYDDPDGDYGRNARQREVLLGILNKFSGVSALTNAGTLLDTVSANVTTDLTWDEMVQLGLNYRVPSENVYSETLVGSAQNSPTAGYLNVLSADQIATTSAMLRDSLEIE